MNQWTPLWSMIVESSLWQDEDDATCKVFVTMLALKHPDHVLRLSAYQIGKKCNKTEAEVLKALKVLEAPDTKRIEPQEFDGRRIERVKDGWLILNGQKYQEMMQEMVRQRQQAQHMREHRMIERAVRTGEGIPPEKMTPSIQKRFERAKAKRKKQLSVDGERSAADVKDHCETGAIMPPAGSEDPMLEPFHDDPDVEAFKASVPAEGNLPEGLQ